MQVSLAVEGVSDLPIARRLVESAGLEVSGAFQKQGKDALNARIPGYNRAAALQPWLVLRDLDHDAPCAPALVARLLPTPAPGMCLRVAVRAAEAWLLADRIAIADFLAVAASRIPPAPDGLEDPKLTLVALAASSRRRAIREDIVPEPGKTAKVGPGYVSRVTQFCEEGWDPKRAAVASPSLSSALEALTRLRLFRVDVGGGFL